MKIILHLTVTLLIILSGCETIEDSVIDTDLNQPALLPVSMKGYELYSWKQTDQWQFTLITGTNRNKTYEEIVADGNIEHVEWIKISVQDVENLKVLLNRLPADQNVSWISTSSRVSGFAMPPASIVSQIQKLCNSRDLELQLIK